MGFSESLEVFLTWVSTVFELNCGEVLFVSCGLLLDPVSLLRRLVGRAFLRSCC
jgi:hypothetical protein